MDVVEIEPATHLWYIRPCTRTYGRTKLQPEPLRGDSAPKEGEDPTHTSNLHLLYENDVSAYLSSTVFTIAASANFLTSGTEFGKAKIGFRHQPSTYQSSESPARRQPLAGHEEGDYKG